MPNENDIDVIRKKIKFYFSEEKEIHIKLSNKQFRNGIIANNFDDDDDFFMFQDRVLGRIPIFFMEVFDVTPYINEKNEGE